MDVTFENAAGNSQTASPPLPRLGRVYPVAFSETGIAGARYRSRFKWLMSTTATRLPVAKVQRCDLSGGFNDAALLLQYCRSA